MHSCETQAGSRISCSTPIFKEQSKMCDIFPALPEVSPKLYRKERCFANSNKNLVMAAQVYARKQQQLIAEKLRVRHKDKWSFSNVDSN